MKTDAGHVARLVRRLLGSAPSLIVATVIVGAALLLAVGGAAASLGSGPILMAPFRW